MHRSHAPKMMRGNATPSAMAGVAFRERIDVVFLHQLLPEFRLVRRRLIRNTENLISRPHVIFRMAVTLEAPRHFQRILGPGKRHLPNRAMTRRAANPLVDVNAVIEIDELRERVYP